MASYVANRLNVAKNNFRLVN